MVSFLKWFWCSQSNLYLFVKGMEKETKLSMSVLIILTKSINLDEENTYKLELLKKKIYWTLTKTWNRSIDRRQGVASDCRLGRTTKKQTKKP